MYSDIAAFYHEIFPVNQAFVNFLQDYLGPAGNRVLDLGCGPGDYIHLIADTHDGTGIDADPEMIRMARSKNRGTFHTMDFTGISALEGPFHCAWCIGNSLSYLPFGLEAAFFQTLAGLLNPSGHFILQVVNWDKYLRTGEMAFPVKTLLDGRTFHRAYEPAANGTVIFQTRLEHQGKVMGRWQGTLFPKTLDRIEKGMASSGLTVEGVYGDYDRSSFSPLSSPALILIARKTVS